MPSFDILKKSIANEKSFKVASIMSKFDLQTNCIQERFKGEIDLTKEWQIGVIYGNSGTGKSTIGKTLFPDNYILNFNYDDTAIIDSITSNKSVDEITKTFNLVGFSSPPSWLKPYSVLSTGEKMRVDLARALLIDKELIVFDEFTSVVDRNIAKIGSYAISKSIKKTNKKFIAISCHDDILEWLEPDWIFNTNNMSYEYIRGHLRRPKIELKIFKQKNKWPLFSKYHYLSDSLLTGADQYVAYNNNKEVAFCAVRSHPHPTNKLLRMIHRLVVLPDYQGIGLGITFLNYITSLYKQNNYDIIIITSNMALKTSFLKDNKWLLQRCDRQTRKPGKTSMAYGTIRSGNRVTMSWRYIGD